MERRQRAVRAVLADRLQDLRREGVDEKLLSLGDKGSSFGKDGSSQDSTNDENDLFERKGWNQMDSGFRLWGAPGFAQSFLAQSEDDPSRSSEDGKVDEFLKSKGWNNVDSGFRII
uniref:Uncharacterized protein n=1 Tax=Entomoneis paludosa TaxID=265537 RepID=A0A6U2X956_9STRA|mmetsp:Transcript_12264/g.25410  ORF Transcript_12264/g.25410 Transcript_12264/m.25410 type:complete len:116 (+) Transcript_12264:2-349(+)